MPLHSPIMRRCDLQQPRDHRLSEACGNQCTAIRSIIGDMGATYANRWDAEKARFGDQPVDPETYGTVLAEVGTAANNVANVIDGVGDMIQDTLSSKPMSYEVRE